MSVVEGPLLGCVGRGFIPDVKLHPKLVQCQGDLLCPLLFDLITVFLV